MNSHFLASSPGSSDSEELSFTASPKQVASFPPTLEPVKEDLPQPAVNNFMEPVEENNSFQEHADLDLKKIPSDGDSLPPTITVPGTLDDDMYMEYDPDAEESSLFVGDLSRMVTEEMLESVFSQFGEIINVDIKRDKVTRNTLGYGFIKFRRRQNAEAAFTMNGTEIGARKIRIGWAQKNTNLFLGALDENEVSSDLLQQIFSGFGPIVKDETYVKNKYGFVKFKYRTHAEKAKNELDGKALRCPRTGKELGNGRPIRIGWGDSNTQRNCVHVQFDATAAEGLTEDDFREQFQKFGKVIKVSLPRYADKRLKGYGFVHFEDNENGEMSAGRAITTLSGKELNGVRIQCNFGKRQVSNGDVPRRNFGEANHQKEGSSRSSANKTQP